MHSLLLIGCGNMGSALLTRWVERANIISHFWVVDPNNTPTSTQTLSHAKNIDELPKDYSPDIIVLAVKPNQLEMILPELAARFKNTATYLSIAAGKTLSLYEKSLGANAQIVRAMPNTPAMIGEGMSAMVGNASLTIEGRALATELMALAGETLWLESEAMMDAATAISGSGPAYFFYFMECLLAAAMDQGFTHQQAETLVYQTATGSTLLAQASEEELATLRARVTSPGGTTQAALEQLMGGDALKKLMAEAVNAAINRAKTMT